MAYSNTEKTIIMDDQYITLDRKRSTLIIIDVQHDFTLAGAAAEVPGTLQSLPHVRRLLQRYRELGVPIVHVIRLYHKDGYNADLCRKKALENGKQVVITKKPTYRSSHLIEDCLCRLRNFFDSSRV